MLNTGLCKICGWTGHYAGLVASGSGTFPASSGSHADKTVISVRLTAWSPALCLPAGMQRLHPPHVRMRAGGWEVAKLTLGVCLPNQAGWLVFLTRA